MTFPTKIRKKEALARRTAHFCAFLCIITLAVTIGPSLWWLRGGDIHVVVLIASLWASFCSVWFGTRLYMSHIDIAKELSGKAFRIEKRMAKLAGQEAGKNVS